MGFRDSYKESMAQAQAKIADKQAAAYAEAEAEIADPFVSFRGAPGKFHYVNSRPGLAAFKTPREAYNDLRAQIAERFPGKQFDLVDFQTEFATAGGMVGWYCYALIREVEG